jgi:CubicO group peptidase (beta-lactamase class C family)
MAIDIDQLLRDTAAAHNLPGIVLGVSHGGSLVSTHAVGTRICGSDAPPDADSVFRIASMTKSFTASAIMLLRDAGGLRLDDAVRTYLPWFDDESATVRDLLTMNAGFPTDDPWGDRHEPTPLAELDALVASGVRRTRQARTGFEYSNLGYALLGRIITVVSGDEYTTFIERELLRPLHLDASVFDHRLVPGERLAQGYAQSAAALRPEPSMLPGAFSPMGGLHSSVRDLTSWVGGFLAAFQAPDAPHPVTAASRREQQGPHTFARMVVRTDADGAPSASSIAYGYGLMVEEHSSLGRFVAHSGGYPGFGSHMRWHPATGIGVVALSNRTYAPMTPLVEQVMYDLVADAEPKRKALDGLWPETREAMDVAESLLRAWDDVLADRHFAHNLDLDQPRSERRHAAAEASAALGGFSRLPETLESRTPAHARWRVSGAAGSAWIEVLMSPDPEPLIQTLRFDLDVD